MLEGTMYKIIALASIPGLEQELNKWFAQGYAPVGGLVVSDGYYLQAIYQGVSNASKEAERPNVVGQGTSNAKEVQSPYRPNPGSKSGRR